MLLVPSAREQGLGPDAARALVRYLFEERRRRRVTVDPAADNVHAISAWHKAGFSVEGTQRDSPDGPVLEMAITNPG